MNKDKLLLLICIILLLAWILIANASCSLAPRHNDRYIKVYILENHTTTDCKLDSSQLFESLDTVWINLATHRVDDTCETAMKGVIQKVYTVTTN